MDGPIFESTRASQSENTASDIRNFECHICFELAQEPIVTQCGHLYCWPCLYQWLELHSHTHECPICKAYVQDDTLIPIYGRGQSGPDPCSRFIPHVIVPSRPKGQRPETSPRRVEMSYVDDWDPTNGFMPMVAVRFGHMALSNIFGVLPKIFSPQMNRFHRDANVYGTTSGADYLYGFHHCHSLLAEWKPMALKFALLALCFVVLFSCICSLNKS